MKLFRRLSALVMALMLVLSLSIGVLAADFDNMADGFAYDGEDTEVNINLKADDEYGYYEAKEGKTYNISSDNGSALLSSSLGGSGTVNIDGAALDYWLFAEEQVDVTINGDVEAELYAYDQSRLTVNGNVDYLSASDQSVVIVNSDVNGSVGASEQAVVTINGDVTAKNGDPNGVDFSDPFDGTWGDDAVYTYGEAIVTITGNVSGGNGYGTDGTGGMGVYATGDSTVIVGGDVTGGNVIADPSTEAYVDEDGIAFNSKGGCGVWIRGDATVSIGGNVTGGSTNGDQGEAGNGLFVFSYSDSDAATVTVAGTVTGGRAENGTDADGIYIKLEEGAAAPSITVSGYDTASGTIVTSPDGEDVPYTDVRDLTQAELDEIITVTGSEGSSAGTTEPDYGTSFYYSRGRLINEHGVSVRALFAFGDDWEETVENGTVTITSAEKKGEVVVTVESLKVMMDVGIETILFNGTKLVLKDAVAEHSAYDTYTITASAILLNGAAV